MMTPETPDADTAALLERMARDFAHVPDDPTVAERRAMLRDMADLYGPPPVEVATVEPRTIDGLHGPVALRIYRPLGVAGACPTLLHIHGGGWALGDPASYERICRAYAAEGRCVVVDVDYRRAPEHRYPMALDDCSAALDWVGAHVDALGGDPHAIVVTGDSAGGNLAAALCQRTEVAVALQILVYPVVDASAAAAYVSRSRLGDGRFFLRESVIRRAEQEYLAHPDEGDQPGASPILADAATLERLPPALIITAGLDPLRDEGVAYARRLEAAGVRVDYCEAAGTIHAFVLFAGAIAQGRAAIERIGKAIRNCRPRSNS